jgi:hypothetical protein
MKAKIMLGILVVALGTAFGMAGRSNSPIPPCVPDVNCPAGAKVLSGEPIPICLPEKPCSAAK